MYIFINSKGVKRTELVFTDHALQDRGNKRINILKRNRSDFMINTLAYIIKHNYNKLSCYVGSKVLLSLPYSKDSNYKQYFVIAVEQREDIVRFVVVTSLTTAREFNFRKISVNTRVGLDISLTEYGRLCYESFKEA